MGVAMGLEGTNVAREASNMILANDNFATIVVGKINLSGTCWATVTSQILTFPFLCAAVREGRVVWDNLRKVLLVNTPINNAQGMSVLFGLAFGLQRLLLPPSRSYSNLICAVTLGFVCAIGKFLVTAMQL